MFWNKLEERKLFDVDRWEYCPQCSDKYYNDIGLLTLNDEQATKE
jgi:hypothetical protein